MRLRVAERNPAIPPASKKAGDNLGYYEPTNPGRAFAATAKPTVISLRACVREIQTELDNRGLTPAQTMVADDDRRGPLFNGGTVRIRAQAYLTQIHTALDSARSLLCP